MVWFGFNCCDCLRVSICCLMVVYCCCCCFECFLGFGFVLAIWLWNAFLWCLLCGVGGV